MRATLEDALALGEASLDRTADDQQLLAQVRINLAFYVYVADEVEAARAPGPGEKPPPILREAIEEARACGAQDVERMALHDLGIATGMLGDSRQSLALVEESMDLARAANDRALLSRCYINVPAIMYTNGETSERIVPLCSEGLERARRRLAHSPTSG